MLKDTRMRRTKLWILGLIAVLLLAVGQTGVWAQNAEPKNDQMDNDQQIVNENKEESLNDPGTQDLNVLPDFDKTSIDLPRLQKAKSLKEIYKLASRMHIGSESDQKALTKAVNDYMMKCCVYYDRTIEEVKRAGFKELHDVTKNYFEHRARYKAEGLEFDKVIISEYRTMVWSFPDSYHVKSFLYSLFPQTRQSRITLYFSNNKLLRVHSVMHTEGL